MIYGGPGDDRINGGDSWAAGTLYGGTGMDVLKGNLGSDKLYGGDDVDVLNARDGVKDNDEGYGGTGDAIYGDRVRD